MPTEETTPTTAPGGVLGYNRVMRCNLHALMEYKGGDYLIYSDLMTALAKTLKKRIKDKHQNVILVVGPTGSGKSTCALNLIYALEPDWNIAENYVYSAEDLARKLKYRATASKITLYDEGSVSLNSLNSIRRSDNMQVVLLDTCRSLGWTTVICIPSINDLNKRIRDHLIDYVLVCSNKPLAPGLEARGFFELYKPGRDTWAKSTYYHLIGAGTYKKIEGKKAEIYDRIKYEHQMALIGGFVNQYTENENEAE